MVTEGVPGRINAAVAAANRAARLSMPKAQRCATSITVRARPPTSRRRRSRKATGAT